VNEEHLKKLRESALTDEQIEALGWGTGINGRLQIPYLKPDGSPEQCHDGKPFIRERLTAAEIGADPKGGKYKSPFGNGCRIYHSQLAIAAGNYDQRLADRFTTLRITEGELKTEAATVHDAKTVTIGLGGVTSWRDRYDGGEDSRPLVEFDEIQLDGREVRLCFDSDLHKPQVLAALKGLAELLKDKGARVLIEVLPHDLNGDRLGVDDLIYRHGAECFRRIAAIARTPFKTKRQDGKDVLVWAFNPEPLESHHKAVTAWAVFNDDYAIRPGFGLYRWRQTHWSPVDGKGAEPMNAPLHQWMDLMGWEKRASTVFGSTRNEVAARLERSGWDPSHLMAFSNGTLDTKTDTFSPSHDHRDQLTFAFPFAYEPGAACSRWSQFLDETIEDTEMIQLLRAGLRWSLRPKDRDQPFEHEVAFDVHGKKGTGKGTLSEVLQAICGGRRGVGLIKSASFSNPNSLFSLIGKRVAVDADASGRVTDPGVFNSVVSNEPVEVKKLYADVNADRLGVVIWRFYNDQPGASGAGVEGMGRRLVTFRFAKPVARRDRQLKATLIAEAAGIFQWAWSMGEQAMHSTLVNVGSIKAVKTAAEDAALEREPILRFLLETYSAGPTSITGADLFRSWRCWAEAQGHEAGSSTRFGREVKKVEAVTFRKTSDGTIYSIDAMQGFNVARHLGIEEPDQDGEAAADESVVGCASNPPPNPPPGTSPDPWEQGKAEGKPGSGGFNSPPEATHHPNPPPSDALQGRGSDDEVVSVVGFEPKTRIKKEVCITSNTANAYTADFALKPTTLTTRPSIDLIPPPAEQIEQIRQRQAKPKPPAHRTPATAAEWVEAALAELRLAPRMEHLPEVVAWIKRQPTNPGIAESQIAAALERLQREDQEVDQLGLEVAA
jgi:P4 family phage/plasmid primase-like protien